MSTSIMDKYVRQNPDTAARIIEGEAAVITPQDSTLHTLNEVATFIWELADGEHTVTQIADALHQSFDVSPEEAQRDTVDFIQHLRDKGLVYVEDEPKSTRS